MQAAIQELQAAHDYIKRLKLYQGGKLIYAVHSEKKTGFYCLLIDIKSALFLYVKYVVEKNIMWFLPTYKLSQDHLELKFAVYRSMLGVNNRQLKCIATL